MAKTKAPASVKPQIFDSILVEVGTVIRDEKLRPTVRLELENPKVQAKLPETVKWLQEVSEGRDADVKALARRGGLKDPLSSMQAQESEYESPSTAIAKALPQSKPRFVMAIPAELTSWVLGLLTQKGFIRDGVMRLGPLLIDPSTGIAYLIEALKYSAPRDAASELRRVNTRGGVSWESVMPYYPEVIKAERDVACLNVEQVIRARTPAGVPEAQIRAEIESAQAMIRYRMAEVARGAAKSTPDAIAIMESGPVGNNLWLIRLTGIRDMDGQLVADHFRALVSFEGDTVKLIPVGIGESKFESGYSLIIPQLIETFKRVREGVSAKNLLPSADIQVQWGSDVVAIVQSEEAPPEGHSIKIEQRLVNAAGQNKLKVTPILMTNQQGATDAREIVRTILEAVMKLK